MTLTQACTKTLKMDIVATSLVGEKMTLKKGEIINYCRMENGIDVYHRISKTVDGHTYVWNMHKYINPITNKETDKVNW